MPFKIEFRPITDEDLPFLKRLYASTRQEEFVSTGWPPERIEAFLDQQFQAQHTFYRDQFTGAAFDLLLLEGQPIGRLYLDRRDEELTIIDIALLPEWRGQGIGGRLLRDILEQSRQTEKPVRIHVEQNNPAKRLYERLGFQKIAGQGVYDHLEWRPHPDV